MNAIGRIAPLVPSVDELLAMAMDPKQSDWAGDMTRDMTALGIALHCGDTALTIAANWEDEHPGAHVPLCVQARLSEALIAAAWERIYSAQTEDDAP